MRYTVFPSICLLALLAVPAQAGQLFPPANIGPKPDVACPSGKVLTWNVDHVDCVNPTPGVTVSCPAGQVLTGIQNGQPVCVNGTKRFQTTWAIIDAACFDPVVKDNPDPFNRPISDPTKFYAKLFVWVNTCGARFCNKQGYVTGKVSEYYNGNASVDCW